MGIFMEKCGIYKITSPNKKVYIGQSKDIEKRFKDYKLLRCKNQKKLYNSLKKHGVEKCKFEILHQCEPEKLNELECYYIDLFQCFNNEYGLNLKSGGSKCKFSEETKRKISESRKGKPSWNKGLKGVQVAWNKGMSHSDETRKKISDAHKGKIVSDEFRKKMSKIHKGKKLSDEHKKKIGEKQKGVARKKPSCESRKKMSIAQTGRKHSFETKQKMSIAQKKRFNNVLITT